MKEVNFAKIMVPDINGTEQAVDFRKDLGNLLYMQGNSIEECELGSAIYHQPDNEPLQLSDVQRIMLRQFVIRLPYVSRKAIQKALE